MGKLEGKAVIITGSSSGVGRTIAIAFAREGARVMCSDIRKAPLEKEAYMPGIATDDIIRNFGGKASFFQCDVTSLAACHDLVTAAVNEFGRLDVIFNNAGVFTKFGRLHELGEYDWDFTVGVNAKGVYNGAHAAITQYLKQGGGGVVINMCSIGGVTALKEETAYCASKFAVAGLTKVMAIDYAKDQIRVNALCPNFMATPMCADFFADKNFVNYLNGLTPMGRSQTTEDLIGPLLFLASDDSAFMTGQLLVIDGGITSRIQ